MSIRILPFSHYSIVNTDDTVWLYTTLWLSHLYTTLLFQRVSCRPVSLPGSLLVFVWWYNHRKMTRGQGLVCLNPSQTHQSAKNKKKLHTMIAVSHLVHITRICMHTKHPLQIHLNHRFKANSAVLTQNFFIHLHQLTNYMLIFENLNEKVQHYEQHYTLLYGCNSSAQTPGHL